MTTPYTPSGDYTLLDSGGERKLEQIGPHRLVRQAPQAVWSSRLPESEWKAADAVYVRDSTGSGDWRFSQKMARRLEVLYASIHFQIKLTDFGHLGLFPEQAENWEWMRRLIRARLQRTNGRNLHVLNLFAYTGGSTLACSQAGAHLVHVDAAKGVVDWAKENAELSRLHERPIRWLVDDALCLAYYDQPELIHDILTTIGEMAFQVLQRVSRAVPVDMLSVHEDMAGKTGPLIGPVQVTEFIAPYYRRIWDLLAERGARLFDQDSDGDMRRIIPAFLDAGVNCMHPIEPASYMDIVALRAEYGQRLAMYGGIDKHVLRGSQEEIVAELEYKIPPLAASGGCVLGLDHRIPNGTPLENYRFYIRKVWEILERCAE